MNLILVAWISSREPSAVNDLLRDGLFLQENKVLWFETTSGYVCFLIWTFILKKKFVKCVLHQILFRVIFISIPGKKYGKKYFFFFPNHYLQLPPSIWVNLNNACFFFFFYFIWNLALSLMCAFPVCQQDSTWISFITYNVGLYDSYPFLFAQFLYSTSS